MSTTTKRWIAGIGVVVTALLVLVLWPVPDPLANAETVAIRVGDDADSASSSRFIDIQSELDLVLSGRNIRVVSDESIADVVLLLDDIRINLGDIEISLTDGDLRGTASAIVVATDLRSGESHTLDFTLRLENGDVRAELTGRRFWEFWK